MPMDKMSRRTAVTKIGVAALAGCGLARQAVAQDYHPQQQSQLTKAAARYQDQPRNSESCASCPYFKVPNGCVVVQGEVSANGWCPMYTQFSPMDRGAHI